MEGLNKEKEHLQTLLNLFILETYDWMFISKVLTSVVGQNLVFASLVA
jgi:hypothetical protein